VKELRRVAESWIAGVFAANPALSLVQNARVRVGVIFFIFFLYVIIQNTTKNNIFISQKTRNPRYQPFTNPRGCSVTLLGLRTGLFINPEGLLDTLSTKQPTNPSKTGLLVSSLGCGPECQPVWVHRAVPRKGVTIKVLPSGDCLALEDSHFGYNVTDGVTQQMG
jgi:hypothetical protein